MLAVKFFSTLNQNQQQKQQQQQQLKQQYTLSLI